MGTHKRRGHDTYIWRRVDQAEEPLIPALVSLVRADVKLRSEEQIRAVDDGFVHLIR